MHYSFWTQPIKNVIIPHTHASHGDGSSIQMFVRLPDKISEDSPAPVMLIITGLDGYRTDSSPQVNSYLVRLGFAIITVEIPGTGDSPAALNDPASADRFFDSVLDWVEKQPQFNKSRVSAWGTSTGGYYAMRVAHTHNHRLKAVVAHGGASHFTFSRDWLDQADGGEYPVRCALSCNPQMVFPTLTRKALLLRCKSR